MMKDETDLSPVTIDEGASSKPQEGTEVIEAPPAAGSPEAEGDQQEEVTKDEVEVEEESGEVEETSFVEAEGEGGDTKNQKPGLFGNVRERIRQARQKVGSTASTVVGTVSTKVVNVKDASKTYLAASTHYAKDMSKRYYDASLNLGKTALDASTGAATSVTAVAQKATEATTQRISEVRSNVQDLANTGMAAAKGSVTGAKDRVVQILRARAGSHDTDPPLYWGVGPGGDGDEGEMEDEEYRAILQFELSQEITIMPGRRERLPYILKKGNTVTWEFRLREHDLGFVVCETVQDFGGAQELPLVEEQKYKAGSTIKGSYTAPPHEDKHIALIWDNSYSILRSKVVAYVVRVLRPESQEDIDKAAGRISSPLANPTSDTAEEEVTAAAATDSVEVAKSDDAPTGDHKNKKDTAVEPEGVVPEMSKVMTSPSETETQAITNAD